jgi:hypothetical protein
MSVRFEASKRNVPGHTLLMTEAVIFVFCSLVWRLASGLAISLFASFRFCLLFS